MEVDIHFSSWDSHEPGKLVLIPGGERYVYALSLRWENYEDGLLTLDGDREGFLILEGERAGETDSSNQVGALRYQGNAEVCLSKRSADWQYAGQSRSPLVIGVHGIDAYFVFRLANRTFCANVKTGAAFQMRPGSMRIANAWSIRESGETTPFVESPAPPKVNAEVIDLHM